MSRYDEPVIDADGRVRYAPNPRSLITVATPDALTHPLRHGVLYIGGSWRPYPRHHWYGLVVTVHGTHEGVDPPACRRHIAWPLVDDGVIDEDVVEQLVREVCRTVLDGEDVLVRCYTGQNRSGLVTALSMRRLYGMTGSEAVGHLRAIRSATALCNPAFEAYVLAADEASPLAC